MRVADTSVAFKWFVAEEDSHLADALLLRAERLVAPDVIFTECAHAVKRRILDGLPQSALDDMCGRLPIILSQVFPTAPLAGAAVRLSLELGHYETNDCFFLALARRESVPLVTADRALIKSARRAGYGDFVVHLADAAGKE